MISLHSIRLNRLVNQPYALIYDATGRQVDAITIEGEEATIRISEREGLYFVLLMDREEEIATMKLIVDL